MTDIIERAARAVRDEFMRTAWRDKARPGHGEFTVDEESIARAVLRAIREPLSDAAVYLVADAEAWETGAKDHPHEAYLMHCGKLRRDVAARLKPLLDTALGEE